MKQMSTEKTRRLKSATSGVVRFTETTPKNKPQMGVDDSDHSSSFNVYSNQFTSKSPQNVEEPAALKRTLVGAFNENKQPSKQA